MNSDTVTPAEVTADATGERETDAADDPTQAAACDGVGDEQRGAHGDSENNDAVDLGKKKSTEVRREPVTRRGLLIPLLAVLVLAMTAGIVVLGLQAKADNDIEAAGLAAQAAAETYAVALTSIDSEDLDSDFATVLDGATGEFKEMYSRSSTQLKQLLIDNDATGQGTVVDSAIKSASADKAEILLFVDQTVTNSAAPEPRIDRSRVLMTMERVDGRWLAAEVTLS